MLGEKSLTGRSSLFLPREIGTVLTTPWRLNASQFKRSRDRTSAGSPSMLLNGRYLCLEPILPVATPVAGLWRSTCKHYGYQFVNNESFSWIKIHNANPQFQAWMYFMPAYGCNSFGFIAAPVVGFCNRSGWSYFPEANSCYKVFDSPKTWPEASNQCVSQGSLLVTITSNAENDFVCSLAPNTDLWIGYTRRTSHGWTWVDSNKNRYTNWAQGQPDDNGGKQFCAMIWGWKKIKTWDDRRCTVRQNFVCKMPGIFRFVLPESSFLAVTLLVGNLFTCYFFVL